MLIEHAKGNYSFIRSSGPFSSGCAALPGFEIVHAAIVPFVPLARGFDLIESHFKEIRRPIDALCAMHLRIPYALTPKEFAEFNRPYVERLQSWGLETNGANPVSRTNVALEANPVPEPMLAGFYHTDRCERWSPTFVLSGAAEMRAGAGGKRELVAAGDTSTDGIRCKLECVLEVLAGYLRELGLGWEHATTVNLYTVHEVHHALASTLLPALGAAARLGLNWHYARPPVTGLEVEIDAHAVRREVILQP